MYCKLYIIVKLSKQCKLILSDLNFTESKETGNNKVTSCELHTFISCLCFYLLGTWQVGEKAEGPKFGKDLRVYAVQLSDSMQKKMEVQRESDSPSSHSKLVTKSVLRSPESHFRILSIIPSQVNLLKSFPRGLSQELLLANYCSPLSAKVAEKCNFCQ